MLHIENASIAYGNNILFSDFNLHLERGEIVGISGPSGCGKSSLLNAILGFIPLKEGHIVVDGITLEKDSVDAVRKRIAWIPQELALPLEWVREMVQLPFGLKANRGTLFSESRLFACFEELGLERELYHKRVNEISGGQRQRMMIAVASMIGKPLIIVDEPTSALDSGSTEKVLAFFHRQAEKGVPYWPYRTTRSLSSGATDTLSSDTIHSFIKHYTLLETIDISYLSLGIGLLLLLIPLFYIWKFKTGLVRATIIGVARMIVQLFFIGIYLNYLFLWDNPWINFLWVIVMIFVASQTALARTHLKKRVLLLPISTGFLCGVVCVGFFFIGMVLKIENVFSARYFIPIFGILMGNMLSSNVIALNTYYSGLKREQQLYRYLLGNGATRAEAQAPFIREAIVKAFSPLIANIAVMGLVALPGTMIGQILGGSSPNVAIKYQMMIMVITFTASMLSLMITISLASRKSFDAYGKLLSVMVEKKKNK